mgnify:CR=1 FL=1
MVKEFEGWRFLLTHTETSHENDLPTDPKPEELVRAKEVDVVLHGHTHVPRLQLLGSVVFVNPGHLKKSDKKGYPPTYAMITVESGRIEAEVRELYSGKILGRLEVYK